MSDKLAQIAEGVRTCQRCALHETRNLAVPGEGNPEAEVMLIGESPGRFEDEKGRPFVGASGKYLNELLQRIGMKRRDIFITNIIKCRPPDNRDPTTNEKAACREWLDEQIATIQPKLIVTMGSPATNTFLPGTQISTARGRAVLDKAAGHTILPMMHPAAVMRQERNRAAVEGDFPLIAEWLEILNVPDDIEIGEQKEPEAEPETDDTSRDEILQLPAPVEPTTPKPAADLDPILTLCQLSQEEMTLVDEEYRGEPETDPRKTRHAMTVIGRICGNLRRGVAQMREGPRRDWAEYMIEDTIRRGQNLSRVVPLICAECDASFYAEDLRTEYCLDCSANTTEPSDQ